MTHEFTCARALESSEGVAARLKRMIQCEARAAGNIKVSLRLITLDHVERLTGGLVASTDKVSEFLMGFWTLNGDVDDYSPIQHISKGLEEYVVPEALGVPEKAPHAVSTDGLDVIPGGADGDQLGLPYHKLDRVIVRLFQNNFDAAQRKPKNKMLLKISGFNHVRDHYSFDSKES